MARNNFQYEKRQRELDKKRKADDKAKRKLEAKNDPGSDDAEGQAPQGAGAAEAANDGQDGADGKQAAVPSSLA